MHSHKTIGATLRTSSHQKNSQELEKTIEFNAIDVSTTVGVASTGHLYLYAQTNIDVPPENVL